MIWVKKLNQKNLDGNHSFRKSNIYYPLIRTRTCPSRHTTSFQGRYDVVYLGGFMLLQKSSLWPLGDHSFSTHARFSGKFLTLGGKNFFGKSSVCSKRMISCGHDDDFCRSINPAKYQTLAKKCIPKGFLIKTCINLYHDLLVCEKFEKKVIKQWKCNKY